MMLKSFLFKRPDWFKHEGYWRLAQVFRLGPMLVCLAFSAYCLAVSFYLAGTGDEASLRVFAIAAAFFAGAAAYVIAIHWLIRLVVWITDGFKESGKPS